MPGIGESLREARRRQRIDISDVERATKIRAKYLRALENEEFGVLPGNTFVRSFLRTYAQYLGLDAQRLLDEYRAHHEPPDDAELQPIAPRPHRQRPPAGPAGPGRGMLLGGAAVLLLALFLVLGLLGGDDDGNGEEGAVETTTQEQEQRGPAAESETRAPSTEQRPRTVLVRVTPSAPIYVCWDRGPDTESTELTELAEARAFRGRRIRINLGNASATVRVGRETVPLEGSGPFGLDFRPGRAPAEIPIGERPCQ